MDGTRVNDWILHYKGFDPEEEGLREALCTVGNGYMASRGAFAQAEAGDVHYPGTYLSFGYNRMETEISGKVIENEDLVNMPNWLCLDFRLEGGRWFRPYRYALENYDLWFDLQRCVLTRSFEFADEEGRRTRYRERRFISMDDKHVAALELTLEPLNWSGRLSLRSGLDGSVVNAGVPRYSDLNGRHLEPLGQQRFEEDCILLQTRTRQSHLRISQAARTRLYRHGERLEPEHTQLQQEPDNGYLALELAVQAGPDAPMTVEKIASLYTSRDNAISESGLEACKKVRRASRFQPLLDEHARVWGHLWNRFEIVYEHRDGGRDSERTEMVLRLYLLHLLQTCSVHTMDLDAGVPSRGWHGEAYRGHIFWDELFIFPTLNFRLPEITRSLLLYRARRLSEAKAAAKAEGHCGAMFPWQSGSDGREESQRIHLNPRSGRWIPDNSRLQRHVNAAIAFNISAYYKVTHDMEFLAYTGAEMFFEIARFWASIAEFDEHRQRYVIRKVMGPDEFHEAYPDAEEPGLDNNAYTNVMAAWVLDEGLRLMSLLPEVREAELREKLGIDDQELQKWRDMATRMFIPFHNEGIISQFEGYEKLKELDWDAYREKYGDIQRMDRILESEDDSPNKYKLSKQADVLMLFYLFSSEELDRLFTMMGYEFDPEMIPRNIDYYLARTSHGSTLSRVVHARILARLNRSRSWKFFLQALNSDINDIQGGTTPEGIHLGAMAGTVDIIQRGYTDIETRDDVLHFNPCIPEELAKLCIRIRYRGHSLEVTVTPQKLTVKAARTDGAPITIGYEDETFELCSGQEKSFDLKQSART